MINGHSLLNPNAIICPQDKVKLWIQSRDKPGLYLEVRQSGRRTWFGYLYIDFRQIRRKLGPADDMNYSEAKNAFDSWIGSLKGVPKKPQTSNRLSVGDCFVKYYEKHLAIETTRPRDYLNSFARYWPSISEIQVRDLDSEAVKDWLAMLAVEFGKETANKQLTILKACIRWSAHEIDRSLKTLADPFDGVKRFKSKPEKRHLKRGHEEESFTKHIGLKTTATARAIEILFLTGQRKSNVLSMRWQDLDLESNSWTIPAKDHKTGRAVTVALSKKAVDLLRSLDKNDHHVFPSARSASGHLENINHFWFRVRDEAGINHLTIHDLRHTLGTWLGQGGHSAFVIQKALGHANVCTTERYTDMDNLTVLRAINEIQNRP